VLGLAVYGLFSSFGYIWIAIALVLVAAGIRVNGVVAGTNVLRGLPTSRTSIFAALFDTASEVATAVGITVGGVMLGGNSRDSVDSAVRSLISSIISGFCEEQLATKGQVVGSYSTRWEPGRA
jgi:molybdopterin biosynthesis enzyme MoaB